MVYGKVKRRCIAMPEMISLLDKTRDLLEELSKLGVTDPVSGTVISNLSEQI